MPNLPQVVFQIRIKPIPVWIIPSGGGLAARVGLDVQGSKDKFESRQPDQFLSLQEVVVTARPA